MLLLLALLLGTAPTTIEVRGDILVRIEPNITVLLDGEAVGISSVRDNGLWIRHVRPGVHKLTFQATNISLDTEVEVMSGQTTPVTISSLTLRAAARKRVSDLEVRVESDALECFATASGRTESITTPRSFLFEDIATGSQRVSVKCDGRTLTTNVDVAAGRTIVVEANFRTKAIKVAQDRQRVKELVVTSARERLIMDAPISSNVKRALMAAIPPTVTVVSTYMATGNRFVVRLDANNSSELYNVSSRLRRSSEIRDAELVLVEEFDQPRRVRMDLVITFGQKPMIR
ncbi:MAG TPA: hypothetical protein VHW00_10535 [Thermoanaerobaculia bacterium]|nr:hypothetical protein [Thermoanaerobaculia bacterium]